MAVDAALAETLRSHIGEVIEEELGTLTASTIGRYASAVGDDNPLYHDRDAARSAGLSDVLAPPNLIPSIIAWGSGSRVEDLRADGTESEGHLPGVPSSGVRVMGGGEVMDFHRPVCAGVELRLRTVLDSVEERTTRSGPMIVLQYRNTYSDENGSQLLTTLRTVLLR